MKKNYFVLVFVLAVTFWMSPSLLGKSSALAAPKIDVVVDFSNFVYGNKVTFVDDKGKDTVFDSVNGIIQSKKMKTGNYSIFWEINPYMTSSCQVHFPYSDFSEMVLPEMPGSTSVEGVELLEYYGGFSTTCR